MELVNNSNIKKLQQIALNVNGQPQMIVLPEGLDVKTLADIKPYITQYLPQDISKYNLIIAETQTQLVTPNAALPVDKARLVIDVDSITKETKFTLGLYAIPIMSKAGAKPTFTRNELVSEVKAIIAKDADAKAFFTVEGKQYNMLKTEVLLNRHSDYIARQAKAKPAKKVKEVVAVVVESVKTAKTKKAEPVKVETKPKVKKAKSTFVAETSNTVYKADNKTVVAESSEAPSVSILVGNTKAQLLAALNSLETVFSSVRGIVESLPNAVVEEVTIKAAIEETVYTFNEYLASLRQDYYSVCEAIPNSKC